VAIPIDIDNVDTDQIFPSRFISKRREDGMYGRYFLHDQRFHEDGSERPEFVVNDPRLRDARIIVAAANYACGSARPGAIFAHIDYGIQVIIAESFGPVFPTVSFKSGLLAIQLPRPAVTHIRDQLIDQVGAKVTVELGTQIVTLPDGRRFTFEIDPFVKRMLMEGLTEIDLTLRRSAEIEAFEARLRMTQPWLYERDSC